MSSKQLNPSQPDGTKRLATTARQKLATKQKPDVEDLEEIQCFSAGLPLDGF